MTRRVNSTRLRRSRSGWSTGRARLERDRPRLRCGLRGSGGARSGAKRAAAIEWAARAGYGENELLVQEHRARQRRQRPSAGQRRSAGPHGVAGRQLRTRRRGRTISSPRRSCRRGCTRSKSPCWIEEGNGELFLRDLEFEKSDWFYVGIADLTAGRELTRMGRPIRSRARTPPGRPRLVRGWQAGVLPVRQVR